MPFNHSPPSTPAPISISIPPAISVKAQLRGRDIRRLVRATFDQTWRDYYAWKPPATLPIINGDLMRDAEKVEDELVRRHRELGEELKRITEQDRMGIDDGDENGTEKGKRKREKERFMGSQKSTLNSNHNSTSTSMIFTRPSSSSSSKSHISKDNNGKSSKSGKSIANTNTNTSKMTFMSKNVEPVQGYYTYTMQRDSDETSLKGLLQTPTTRIRKVTNLEEDEDSNDGYKVETIPPYYFCSYGHQNIYVEDEGAMPFIPVFRDDQDFNEEKWFDQFGRRMAWVGAWRDPEVDIIQVEALSRIRTKSKNLITSEQIDQTRILPLEVTRIENLDLSRDLPPFPLDPSASPSYSSNPINPRKRKWNEPLKVKVENQDGIDMNDMGDLLCSRQGCTIYGCLRHSSLEDNHLTIHSISSNQHSLHPKYIPKKRAKLPEIDQDHKPCSDQCYSLSTPSELREQASNCQIWPKTETVSIIEIMSSDCEITSGDLCMLSLRSNGYTCKEVAIQIMALAALDSTIPTPLSSDFDQDSITTQVSTIPNTKNQPPRFVSVNQAPALQECNHPGPCVSEVCPCFTAGWMCGRNCGCSFDCKRRNMGCNCHRIFPGNGNKSTKGACTTIDTCPCARSGRECDPELCGPCGSEDEISAARFHLQQHGNGKAKNGVQSVSMIEIERKTYCGNVNLQKGIFPKLRVGISEVSGYGVIADEHISKGRVIGEYVGEVISKAEGGRRDQINDQIGRQYIFSLNGDSDIDAGNYGNITRFINSGKGQSKNVTAKTMIINDEARIAFFAIRNIRKNEELRFDYGDDFDSNGISKKK
ncbi:hypothetical protein V866_006200 [Kwoniella sp. B9012]